MTEGLIDPHDSLERQNEKLLKITATLMRRVEQDTDASGLAYAQFERAVLLEEEIRSRTRDLERTLDLLNLSNAKLAEANRETEAARANLANAIETVQEGFALFNAEDVLVMCNSRFGMHMPDICADLRPGLRFESYVQLISSSTALSLPAGTSAASWAARRLARHQDRSVMFNVRMTGNRWVQVSEHRTPDGGTVILQTDVTDIMRLQHQERERILDDQARLIRATLEHLNQGVCIFDQQARLVGWNRLMGNLLSIPIGRFRIGSRFESIFEQLRDTFTFAQAEIADQVANWARPRTGLTVGSASAQTTTDQSARAPLSFDIQQGTTRVLTVFMQDMPDGGFVISFTDVTAERQTARAMSEARDTLEQRVLERTLELEDALQAAERANASKSRFVAAASHDLLQPLSAAKLFVAALDSELPDELPKDTLHKAANALDSVETLVSALLDISRLDSGRAEVHKSSVDLDDLLGQLQDEMRPTADAKGLSLRLRPSRARVLSDVTYLRRILQNLISNALRYTDQGGVLIGIRPRRATVRVEVWDTGPGIPDEDRGRIFAEFQRLNATASAADGMGLGLAIVERACALLGHPLTLRSELGRGTVFAIELPRDVSRPQIGKVPPLKAAAPRPVPTQLPQLIALLIVSDTDLRQALSLTMEQWGIDVLTCASEGEARILLTEIELTPDVLLIDLQLGANQSGARVIEGLRRDLGPLPACLISSSPTPDTAALAQRLNAQLFAKPIPTEQLRSFLNALRSPKL
ncbi:hybrid sensor histidine kinase/response regulator [Phaeobacter gallaeciensis]|uniref:histidine kinase n=1 Tax=Phaeobacter gallaeciensis TaxID=60890 RepID=A0AAD0ECA9_9RHOB|nr:PAS-domain containing protein [Phaeobacter gallaeciensis]AHD08945.1 Signal transduction histidine kinase [Phaeobacter gallaeciensis DSM 26640]ATE92211.1 signal transduction histidine kinase [Phaeobacter gallaeciensis]ATE97970.1 signal transduction histidine kinase [Phaeobacter gallaeciensis]ATF00873.1 signal transduction histidine kinase [Phaeobacter gallaeciensis]ATF05253.1 signal transduction histidine kinase [Phaeobacter gallaeciensis]